MYIVARITGRRPTQFLAASETGVRWTRRPERVLTFELISDAVDEVHGRGLQELEYEVQELATFHPEMAASIAAYHAQPNVAPWVPQHVDRARARQLARQLAHEQARSNAPEPTLAEDMADYLRDSRTQVSLVPGDTTPVAASISVTHSIITAQLRRLHQSYRDELSRLSAAGSSDEHEAAWLTFRHRMELALNHINAIDRHLEAVANGLTWPSDAVERLARLGEHVGCCTCTRCVPTA